MEADDVKERPILFSAEMVRAILDGRKTQTRRVMLPQPTDQDEMGFYTQKAKSSNIGLVHMDRIQIKCHYGEPGDRLWVRESFRCMYADQESDELRAIYKATDDPGEWSVEWRDETWRPSIHMPRWASRIALEIERVEAQRLQDMMDDDAEAEGFTYYGETLAEPIPPDKFRDYWDQLNKRSGYTWDSNPWVWVIEFRRL